MTRSSRSLLLASHNAGKRAELRVLLGASPWTLIEPEAVDLPEPEELGHSFTAIARLKARAAAAHAGVAAIADDTGLCVDALEGGPGLTTRRWAEAHGGWVKARLAMATQLGLVDQPGRRAPASFACAMAWAQPDGRCWSGFARVLGVLSWPARAGVEGPGFVPIFTVQAQPFMRQGVLGHRRAAFARMLDARNRRAGAD